MRARPLACYRCGAPDADPSDFLCGLCQWAAVTPQDVRLRVLTDPVIAAAYRREEEALYAWAAGRNVKELRRLQAAYVKARGKTAHLRLSRPAVDPFALSPEAPS